MSAAINKAAVIGTNDFDEETWLVEPPSLPTHSDAGQGSGRIVEWLQGAAMNVDFQTRSALSRKLASQAAKRKKRAEKLLEKAANNGHSPKHLARVQEELIENSPFGDAEGNLEGAAQSNWIEPFHCNEKSGKHLEVLYENEQPQVPGAVGTASARGNGTAMTSDDDENDEFYDASSEFVDLPPKLRTTTNAPLNSPATINDSRDKLILNGSPLAAVSEYTELSPDGKAAGVISLSSNGSRDDARYVRHTNTARVSPTVIQNAISQRPPQLDRSTPLYKTAKSHSLSTQPDLNDIRSIVERQETELREELSRLKCSVYGENEKTSSQRARMVTQVQSARPATSTMASSKSVEFGAKLSPLATSSPISHVSRLPTPIRKSIGRSMIPMPRTSVLSRSAVRGLAGGSTPSLAIPSQHTADETRSECGGISRNEQRWADECF